MQFLKPLAPAMKGYFSTWPADCTTAMSDVSEEAHCAGWLYSWEYPMWYHAFNHPFEVIETHIAINDDVSVAQINHVMELSMKCQGWICYDR